MTSTAVAPHNAAQAAFTSGGVTSNAAPKKAAAAAANDMAANNAAANSNAASNSSSNATSSSTQTSIDGGLSSIASNFQSFLTLLTTQLKNQDPTSPLDTNQFTQQVTQMTGVQQQLLSNQLLQQLVASQGSVTSAANMIGMTVTAPGVNQGDPNISGVVTGVENYQGQTMLIVGDYLVPTSSVLSISNTPTT
ncbi:MAG TPA: flagellar hook capping FlgD N-terminal domain-containing protein [Caulobacteraceae bacterium]|nr:flagellar hook capping FlgD N-terminal domain-containing protein [Caulobacteraceae bacterium]